MGIEIDRTSFTAADYLSFREALEENLARMEKLLASPDFGRGPGSIGAELEMYIVDADGRPLHVNEEIARAAGDDQLTLELNRYNLEYNLTPQSVSGTPFAAMETEIIEKLAFLGGVAQGHGARIVATGILPTLRESDFGTHCITDRKRYHALVQQLLLRRGGQFQIDIDGAAPLRLEMADITLEGANTSFQLHLRVAPDVFADMFNAIQLMTPLALAAGSNSPTLFGHRLWHETRVPLFKQSIDTRELDRYDWNQPPRVSFGQGWVRRGAAELFAEVVRLYPALLPICGQDNRLQEPPSLNELRLHQSTVWLWNRPVYDPAGAGHLRIEMRALPAGPTAVDMAANAALLVGLAAGARDRMGEILPAIPFNIAEHNFYRAAQFGLEARLVWPDVEQAGFRERGACDVLAELLPMASEGLCKLGVDEAEASTCLAVIEERLRARSNGSLWQLAALDGFERSLSAERARHAMLERYMTLSAENIPVAEWPL